ncbi:hypothetical protein THAOC_02652 [Thalassiosira oceanica]|uniref:Uncharacterized protein n=1 Tax=Thalassiosira oceanica TaxID=159749 RepID=K0TDW9_THAOC|nr:hypothetical protein THAOC_02652 [Thalassiosira oceanica]|eukprot:EJK75620.1 hypothetical protein THAOC_02652 [Thalassiosira oceanica]
MGNQGSVPKQSNEEWIVLTVPKSCKLQCCGYFELTKENIDGRLIQDIYQRAGGGKGLVPAVRKTPSPCSSLFFFLTAVALQSLKNEVDSKFEEFNSQIGRGRMRVVQCMWLTIFLVATIPHLMRYLLKDQENIVPLVLLTTYIPMIASVGLLYRHIRKEKERVREIFGGWQRYGIEQVEWIAGSKHVPPRLGFKIAKARQEDFGV